MMKEKEGDDYDKGGMEAEVGEMEKSVKRKAYVDAEVETELRNSVGIGIETEEFGEEKKKQRYVNGGK